MLCCTRAPMCGKTYYRMMHIHQRKMSFTTEKEASLCTRNGWLFHDGQCRSGRTACVVMPPELKCENHKSMKRGKHKN